MMETFRFQFNTEYARNLRDAVNDRRKQSIDNVHDEKQTKGSYCAWDRICAAMDRLEDTLDYLNHIELGKDKRSRSAFDFYDFINNAYIVIDCIKTIGKIFRVDNRLIEEIENSTSVFKNEFEERSTDQKYFEYIRSLCSVHPLCTNHQKEFLNGSQFHCCPFVSWKNTLTLYNDETADLIAFIYPSNRCEKTIYLGLYVSQFEQYLAKWIDFIPKIIEAKNAYTDKEYERLRNEKIKNLAEFDNNIIQWLAYLKDEYLKRFDYGNDYLFDKYIRFFKIELSDSQNNIALEKYQNAIRYALGFLRNELQNMSYYGYENNGIEHPEAWLETTLFDSIGCISPDDGIFAKYGYNLQKVYYLEPDGDYGEYDKFYARRLLEEPKKLINQYVHFTNTEPDAERAILIQLALYLDTLTRKSFLNKNIPNKLEYRMQLLTDEQYDALFLEEKSSGSSEYAVEDLPKLLEKYGG